MQAGPYRCLGCDAVEGRSDREHVREGFHSQDIVEETAGAGKQSNMVVCGQRTREIIERILVWRAAQREETPPERTAWAQELLETLDKFQKELDMEREACQNVRWRTELAIRGFHDRHRRYCQDIAAAQEKLLDHSNEHKDLKAILSRRSEELGLLREATTEAKRSLEGDRQRCEAEEARSKNDLATITADRKELAEHLEGLREQSAQKGRENSTLRTRAEQLRASVIVFHK